MQFDLDNPKNGSQYQLYKMRLAVEQLAGELVSIAKSFVAGVTPYIDYWHEFQRLQELGAKANPKVAHLANHAKTQRARIKNQRRLYMLGKKINGGE